MCALLTGLSFRGMPGRRELRRSFALLFASAGIAALAAAPCMAFFYRRTPSPGRLSGGLPCSLSAFTACEAWSIGGRLIFAGRTAQRIEALAGGEFVVYAIIVLAVDQRFWIAIANYAPSVVFLAIALAFVLPDEAGRADPGRTHGGGPDDGCGGRAEVSDRPPPVYFNHNALYHLIQMSAFVLSFSRAGTSSRRPTAGGEMPMRVGPAEHAGAPPGVAATCLSCAQPAPPARTPSAGGVVSTIVDSSSRDPGLGDESIRRHPDHDPAGGGGPAGGRVGAQERHVGQRRQEERRHARRSTRIGISPLGRGRRDEVPAREKDQDEGRHLNQMIESVVVEIDRVEGDLIPSARPPQPSSGPPP